ncbi:hypothetical protein ACWGLC_16010 [Dietzia sp. NPDC055877]
MTNEQSSIGRPATCLYLYPANGGKPQVLELQPSADTAEVERGLRECPQGQFVSVPTVFANGWEDMNAQVQPHLWGAWLIGQAYLPDSTPR